MLVNSETSDDVFEIRIDKIPSRAEATFNCMFIAPLLKRTKVVSESPLLANETP